MPCRLSLPQWQLVSYSSESGWGPISNALLLTCRHAAFLHRAMLMVVLMELSNHAGSLPDSLIIW